MCGAGGGLNACMDAFYFVRKNVVNDCHLTPIFYADSQHLDKK